MTRTEHRASIVLDLFETSYHRVYCFCRRSLAPDMAEDIAQDVFTRLLQIERLPEMTLSISYLIKIADNLIKRRYNRNQRFQRFLEANDTRMDDPSDDSWAGLDTEELGDEMWGRVGQITSALDALGTLDRVTTERLTAVLFDRIRRAGIE